MVDCFLRGVLELANNFGDTGGDSGFAFDFFSLNITQTLVSIACCAFCCSTNCFISASMLAIFSPFGPDLKFLLTPGVTTRILKFLLLPRGRLLVFLKLLLVFLKLIVVTLG